MKTIKQLSHHIVALMCGLALIVSFLPKHSLVAEAQTISFSGYGWSDTIGWMQVEGPTYGIRATPEADRIALSGYAWTSTIGWISFEESSYSDCLINELPSEQPGITSCAPYIDMTGAGPYRVRGFARACAVFESGCSGQLKQELERGGWDGYISLNSGNGPWGWQLSADKTKVTGYAWGDSVIGWLDIDATCTNCDTVSAVDTFSEKACASPTNSYVPEFEWSTNPLATSCRLVRTSPAGGTNNGLSGQSSSYIPSGVNFEVPASGGPAEYTLYCTRSGVETVIARETVSRCAAPTCPDGSPVPPSGVCATPTCPDGSPVPPSGICSPLCPGQTFSQAQAGGSCTCPAPNQTRAKTDPAGSNCGGGSRPIIREI